MTTKLASDFQRLLLRLLLEVHQLVDDGIIDPQHPVRLAADDVAKAELLTRHAPRKE